jgi:tRNA threonylcarbamoyladenosine biosynthesis protein TsaB
MRILAIDTSVGTGSVAAVDDHGSSDRPLGPAGGHARVLTATLAEVVADRGWGDLGTLGPGDVIAVVRGPGSFTGLRVGITTAKSISWTTRASLVGVSGFEVIASRAMRIDGWRDQRMVIAYDAGRGEVYVATASPLDHGWTVAPPALFRRDEWLASLPRGSHVTGPAADALETPLLGRGDLMVAPPEARHPRALEAAAIARRRAESGDFDDPHALVPDYLRPSYAEEGKGSPAG